MVQLRSLVRIADNSGCFLAQCIGFFKKKSKLKVGDVLVLSIKGVYSFSSLKKGDVTFGVLVRTVKEFSIYTGDYIKFSENSVILLNSLFIPQFNRILGPFCLEFWPRSNRKNFQRNYFRVISIGSFFV